MLLQTNSYVVPKDKRSEHVRLVRRFRKILAKIGCEQFGVYEQVSQNWGGQDSGGRYVQIMRFRDRRHQLEVQAAERSDPEAQALIQEFCELINFPFQQQQGLFAVGFYTSVLTSSAVHEAEQETQAPPDTSNPLPGEPTAAPFMHVAMPPEDEEAHTHSPFGTSPTQPAAGLHSGSAAFNGNPVPDLFAATDPTDPLEEGSPFDSLSSSPESAK